MGAKQSKRSVDISGKEAEGGEVAAAGAVGEGRVEQLADVDAFKPQLNGDAHIHEQTDKEKQLDSGTPENEKDATTEKEEKEQQNDNEKEKEEAPVTNGDAETKPESGEATPVAEDGKKPKKEKVKKKWSLRSISFSRKDKPKQEKKQKEDELKTNGETEKVPEEAAEASPEAVSPVVEEVKSEQEVKEEKTPETPVTEPLTNGSSTPESAKAESPAAEVAAPAQPPAQEPDTQPEQLTVNGLSLEESKPEESEPAKIEPSKIEEQPITETPEPVPAPDIPVKKEVCVEKVSLETPPPPLPANPPPSSVVSFAATTMALELTDASLPNTADYVISAPHSAPDTKADNDIDEIVPTPVTDTNNTENITVIHNTEIESVPTLKENIEETLAENIIDVIPPVSENKDDIIEKDQIKAEEPVVTKEEEPVVAKEDQIKAEEPVVAKNKEESTLPVLVEAKEVSYEVDIKATSENNLTTGDESSKDELKDELIENIVDNVPICNEIQLENSAEVPVLSNVTETEISEPVPVEIEKQIETPIEVFEPVIEQLKEKSLPDMEDLPVPEPIKSQDLGDATNEPVSVDDLPPPPPPEDDYLDVAPKAVEAIVEKALIQLNGHENLENGVSEPVLENGIKESVAAIIECNGSGGDKEKTVEESVSPAEVPAPGDQPPPAAAPHHPQESLPVSDKLADLIPEVPVVPELNTDTLTETTTDVAVNN